MNVFLKETSCNDHHQNIVLKFEFEDTRSSGYLWQVLPRIVYIPYRTIIWPDGRPYGRSMFLLFYSFSYLQSEYVDLQYMMLV